MDLIRQKAESSLKQLKQFYIGEKQNIECKLLDEKRKNIQMTSSIERDFKTKLDFDL